MALDTPVMDHPVSRERDIQPPCDGRSQVARGYHKRVAGVVRILARRRLIFLTAFIAPSVGHGREHRGCADATHAQ
jgi:hypothetical protein